MKKVKLLVVGRLFQSELVFLNAFENVDFVFYDTYQYFDNVEKDKQAFYDGIDGVVIWDECQHLLYEAIAYEKPVIYRKFRGIICEESLEKHLLSAEEKNLMVMVFETAEFDALYKYIKAQIPAFEKDYGEIVRIEALLKASFSPRVSNAVFMDEIGGVVKEYARLIPFWFPKLYDFTAQEGSYRKHEHSLWGQPMFGDFRYFISADTDEKFASRQIAFEMKTKGDFVISFSNHSKKLSVHRKGKEIHSREVPLENYFEVIRPQFDLFFKEVLGK